MGLACLVFLLSISLFLFFPLSHSHSLSHSVYVILSLSLSLFSSLSHFSSLSLSPSLCSLFTFVCIHFVMFLLILLCFHLLSSDRSEYHASIPTSSYPTRLCCWWNITQFFSIFIFFASHKQTYSWSPWNSVSSRRIQCSSSSVFSPIRHFCSNQFNCLSSVINTLFCYLIWFHVLQNQCSTRHPLQWLIFRLPSNQAPFVLSNSIVCLQLTFFGFFNIHFLIPSFF